MTVDCAIIGGGISGLTAAYELHKSGHSVVVLERQRHAGGNAVSERFDGYLMEHGPSTLNAMVPQALELTAELGLAGEKINLGDGVKRRYLRDNKDLHGISVGPAGFLLSPYLSLPGRLAVLSEILKRPAKSGLDETVHAFTTRRFGREFADKVMEPLAAGMFGGDSDKLSIDMVFPKLRAMEQKYGSVTGAIIRAKNNAEPGKRLFSLRQGVGFLPRVLQQKLPERVKTGVAVKSIARSSEGYQIATANSGTIGARSVVLAVQPHVAAGLLEPLDANAASAAGDIAAPPMSVVFLAYKRQQVSHPLDSLGFLSVKNGNGIITGAQFCSTMFDDRAPEGHISIAAYVGGTRNPDVALLEQAELSALVHREFADLLAIRGEPLFARCRQWVRSLPQYNIGHGAKVDLLQSLGQRQEGLHVAGNYLSGVSIANCIAQAKITATKVDNFLNDDQAAGQTGRLIPTEINAG